jgi:BMFP domain-containing protein YqiC
MSSADAAPIWLRNAALECGVASEHADVHNDGPFCEDTDLMQVDNKLLDDLARVAGGAVGALTGLRGEVEAQVRQQFERILSRMDVVSREEFEAAREMAVKARTGEEELADRVTALEALVATLVAERELAAGAPGPKRPATSHSAATHSAGTAPGSTSGSATGLGTGPTASPSEGG